MLETRLLRSAVKWMYSQSPIFFIYSCSTQTYQSRGVQSQGVKAVTTCLAWLNSDCLSIFDKGTWKQLDWINLLRAMFDFQLLSLFSVKPVDFVYSPDSSHGTSNTVHFRLVKFSSSLCLIVCVCVLFKQGACKSRGKTQTTPEQVLVQLG